MKIMICSGKVTTWSESVLINAAVLSNAALPERKLGTIRYVTQTFEGSNVSCAYPQTLAVALNTNR